MSVVCSMWETFQSVHITYYYHYCQFQYILYFRNSSEICVSNLLFNTIRKLSHFFFEKRNLPQILTLSAREKVLTTFLFIIHLLDIIPWIVLNFHTLRYFISDSSFTFHPIIKNKHCVRMGFLYHECYI